MPQFTRSACPSRSTSLPYRAACSRRTQSSRQYRHPSIDASGIWNSDLGQLGDDREEYLRWQTRMVRYCREGNCSRSNRQNNQPPRPLAWAAPRPRSTEKNQATVTTHERHQVTSGPVLAATAVSRPRPPLPLSPCFSLHLQPVQEKGNVTFPLQQ